MNVAFHRFKCVGLVDQVHICGLSNIHNFEPNISLIRLFSLIFNYEKPQMLCRCPLKTDIYDAQVWTYFGWT